GSRATITIFALSLHDALPICLAALRVDRDVAVGAVLNAELDEDQPQEVVDLGQRRDRALAPAAARALLNRDGRRDAVDGIDVGRSEEHTSELQSRENHVCRLL